MGLRSALTAALILAAPLCAAAEAEALALNQRVKAAFLYKFTAFVEGNPILKDIAEHTFSNRSIENSVGKVSGTLTSSTGGVVPVAYQLVKEHDTWKILYIDLTGG